MDCDSNLKGGCCGEDVGMGYDGLWVCENLLGRWKCLEPVMNYRSTSITDEAQCTRKQDGDTPLDLWPSAHSLVQDAESALPIHSFFPPPSGAATARICAWLRCVRSPARLCHAPVRLVWVCPPCIPDPLRSVSHSCRSPFASLVPIGAPAPGLARWLR